MKTNRILLRVGTLIMVLTMLLCIAFTFYIRLDQPVFLKYCIETSAVSEAAGYYSPPLLQLQYFTNREDQRKVTGLTFKEVPGLTLMATETLPGNTTFFIYGTVNQSYGINLGRYSLRTVYVYQTDLFQEEWRGERELNTAEIQFNDGSTMTVDIGRIIFYSEEAMPEILTNFVGTSSFNNNTSSYTVKSDITVTFVKSLLLKDIPDYADFRINNQSFDGIAGEELKKGSSLSFTTQLDAMDFDREGYDVYDIRPKFYYEAKDGTEGFLRIYNVTWQRGFADFKEALDYLLKRRAF